MPSLCLQNNLMLITVGSELRCYPTNKKGLPTCKKTLWKIDVPIVTRNDLRTDDISRFKVKDKIAVCGNR